LTVDLLKQWIKKLNRQTCTNKVEMFLQIS